jgi:hypothetical protein
MAREPAERYQTADEMAAALEAFQTNAVVGVPERSPLRIVTGALLGVVVVAMLFAIVMVWHSTDLKALGLGALVMLLVAGAGLILSLIEWGTRGRYTLGSLMLALAIGTMIYGIGLAVLGLSETLHGLISAGGVEDPLLFRKYAAYGASEALGNVPVAATLSALQLVVWALLRRRADAVSRRDPRG